jgi:hypothetical protein
MTIRTRFRNPAPLAFALGLTALGALASLGAAAPALAQSTSGAATSVPAAAAGPAAAGGTGDAGGGHHPGSRALNNYLAQLHGSLRITAAEEPLWNSFAQVMRDDAYTLGQAYRGRREKLRSMTAIEDLDSYISVEQARLDGLKRTSAAFSALYAQMPPDQQKVADALFLEDLPGGPHHRAKGKAEKHKDYKKRHDAAPAAAN